MILLSNEKRTLILSAAVVLLLACVCVGSVTAAEEIPPFPVQVWGTVTIYGDPAPAGSIITAKIGDKVLQSFILSEEGKMGEGGTFGDKFVLTGTSDDVNKVISFWMGTTQATETIIFSPGEVYELSLTFEIPTATVVPTQTSAANPTVSATPAQNINKVVTPVENQASDVSSVMLQSINTAESIPSNIQVIISPLAGTVQMPSTNAYIISQKMDITVENPPASGVSGTLVFTIQRNSVAKPANVVMLHFENGVWSELPTSLVSLSADGNSITYTAETPSFSPFAIAEKVTDDIPSGPTTTQTDTSIPTSSTPVQTVQTSVPSGQNPTQPTSTPGFGVLLGGLGILGAVYLRRTR